MGGGWQKDADIIIGASPSRSHLLGQNRARGRDASLCKKRPKRERGRADKDLCTEKKKKQGTADVGKPVTGELLRGKYACRGKDT